jgi:uracil-DNA glycosylase
MEIREILGDWYPLLEAEFSKDYMINLADFVITERNTKIIYPEAENVFNAYKYTQYADVKVCLIGMDPYINKDQAHGLSFSVMVDKTPPSLRIIKKAIEESCYNGLKLDATNDLTYLAKQGVMLLNSILTVEEGKSGSHRNKGWEIFTGKTIELIKAKKEPVVFLLFGKDASKLVTSVPMRHLVISVEHPAASIYSGKSWQYNNCFVKTNQFLYLANGTSEEDPIVDLIKW